MATRLELYLSTHDSVYDVDLSNIESRQLHHVLEDQDTDSDYKRALSIILDKSDQIYEQHKRKKENVVYIDDKHDSNVDNVKGSRNDMGQDPQYLHLLQNDNLENDRYVYMDKGESSRRLNGVKKHEPQSASVKKTNGTDKVDNMKGLPSNMVGNLEHHHLQRSVKCEDDRRVYMHKGHALVNKKISGVNNEIQGMRKLSMKQKVGVSNQHDMHPTLIKNLTVGKSSRHELEKVKIEKRPFNKFSAYRDIDENNLEEKGKDSSDSDVEILDSAAINEEGAVGPFVSSKKFHKSIREDGCESSATEEFRKQVLDVLRKPFDKEEYVKHQQEVKGYLDYHPDLKRKLTKYRYKQGKRLTIYRGFFFWLQNLIQEGSFKPWEDRECLAVESA